MTKRKMTREAASRIQSAACKTSGGIVVAGSFAARAMSAAYKNEPLSRNMRTESYLLSKCGFFAISVGIAAVAAAASYYLYKSYAV